MKNIKPIELPSELQNIKVIDSGNLIVSAETGEILFAYSQRLERYVPELFASVYYSEEHLIIAYIRKFGDDNYMMSFCPASEDEYTEADEWEDEKDRKDEYYDAYNYAW